jgi:hypothetical protein
VWLPPLDELALAALFFVAPSEFRGVPFRPSPGRRALGVHEQRELYRPVALLIGPERR